MIQIELMTKKLKSELSILQQKFETGNRNQDRRDRQLFDQMKTETAPIFKLIDMWYEQTIEIIQKEKLILREQQITSTKENFEMLVLHSYYIDVRKRRYMELNRSCLYIFDQLLKEIHRETDTH